MSPTVTDCHTPPEGHVDEATHYQKLYELGVSLCPMTSPKVPHLPGLSLHVSDMVVMMAPPPRAAARLLVLRVKHVAHSTRSVTASWVIRSLAIRIQSEPRVHSGCPRA